MKARIGLALLMALGLGCGSDDDGDGDQAVTYDIDLTAAAEVPTCATGGAAATGSATVEVNAANTSITVSDLTYSGLSGAPTMAHIHFGGVGSMGPVVLNFGATLTSPINKTFTAADYASPVPAGAPATFVLFVAALRTGMAYINVHTTACTSGEIRGHIL